MDIEISENRSVMIAAKSESQTNGRTCATNDDKKDLLGGNCEKTDNVVRDLDFPFREVSSSAINDSNNQMSDISAATECNTESASEIKQEDSCNSPADIPLPSYAISNIQVG